MLDSATNRDNFLENRGSGICDNLCFSKASITDAAGILSSIPLPRSLNDQLTKLASHVSAYRKFSLSDYTESTAEERARDIAPLAEVLVEKDLVDFAAYYLTKKTEQSAYLNNGERALLCALNEINPYVDLVVSAEGPVSTLHVFRKDPISNVMCNYTSFAQRFDRELFTYIGSWLNEKQVLAVSMEHRIAKSFSYADCKFPQEYDELKPWLEYFTTQGSRDSVYVIADELNKRIQRGDQSLFDHLVVALRDNYTTVDDIDDIDEIAADCLESIADGSYHLRTKGRRGIIEEALKVPGEIKTKQDYARKNLERLIEEL